MKFGPNCCNRSKSTLQIAFKAKIQTVQSALEKKMNSHQADLKLLLTNVSMMSNQLGDNL